MHMTSPRRRAERGQALVLALVLLGLLSVFSVSALRLASASQITATSMREASFRDAQGVAGGLMARQLVADGLGCSSSAVTAQFAGATVRSTVAQSVNPLSPPPACATQDNQNGQNDGGKGRDKGTVPGLYVICSTVSSGGVDFHATVTVSAAPSGDGTTLTVDIVHLTYGGGPPC